MADSRYLELIKKKIVQETIFDPLIILKSLLIAYTGQGSKSSFYYSLTRHHHQLCEILLKQTELHDIFKTLNDKLDKPLKSKSDFNKLLSAFFNVYPGYLKHITPQITSQLKLSDSVTFNFMTNFPKNLAVLFVYDHHQSIYQILGEVLPFLEGKESADVKKALAEKLNYSEYIIKQTACFSLINNSHHLSDDIKVKVFQTLILLLKQGIPYTLLEENIDAVFNFIIKLPEKLQNNLLDEIFSTLTNKSSSDFNIKYFSLLLAKIWSTLNDEQKNKFKASLLFILFGKIEQGILYPIIENLTSIQKNDFSNILFDNMRINFFPNCSLDTLRTFASSTQVEFENRVKTEFGKTIAIHKLNQIFRSLTKETQKFTFEVLLKEFSSSMKLETLMSAESLIEELDLKQQYALGKAIFNVLLKRETIDNPSLYEVFIRVLGSLDIEVFQDLKEPIIKMLEKYYSEDDLRDKNVNLYLVYLKTLGKLRGLTINESKWYLEHFEALMTSDFSSSYNTRLILINLWTRFSEGEQDFLCKVLCNLAEKKVISTFQIFSDDILKILPLFTHSQKHLIANTLKKVIPHSNSYGFYFKIVLDKIMQSLPENESKGYLEPSVSKEQINDNFLIKIVHSLDSEISTEQIYNTFYPLSTVLSEKQKNEFYKKLYPRKDDKSHVKANKLQALKAMGVTLDSLLTKQEQKEYWQTHFSNKIYDFRNSTPHIELSFLYALTSFWQNFTPTEIKNEITNLADNLSYLDEANSNVVESVLKHLLKQMDYPTQVAFMVILSNSKNLQTAMGIDVVVQLFNQHHATALLNNHLPKVLTDIVQSYTDAPPSVGRN